MWRALPPGVCMRTRNLVHLLLTLRLLVVCLQACSRSSVRHAGAGKLPVQRKGHCQGQVPGAAGTKHAAVAAEGSPPAAAAAAMAGTCRAGCSLPTSLHAPITRAGAALLAVDFGVRNSAVYSRMWASCYRGQAPGHLKLLDKQSTRTS